MNINTSKNKNNLMDAIWIVIAAFNEGAVIADVIHDARKIFKNIVVVDDCSEDETADLAFEAGAHVISHPINLGQGASLQTGIDYALSKNPIAVITFDADGQHRKEDALSMVKYLIENRFDIVCGSRFLGVESKTMPLKKMALLKVAAWFTKITTGIPVTDAHNGLRVFSYRAANLIRIRHNRMAHASEIISQVYEKQLKFSEYPVEILYSSYSIQKGQKMSNSINILLDLFLGKITK